MAFICRTCKSKFLLATSPLLEEVDVSIVSTLCGHLFHRKCLEASLTNQKLSHAMAGTGPFRPFCPALSCGNEIQENGIVEICTVYPRNLDQDEDEIPDGDRGTELKLIKKCQYLSTERDKLEVNLEKVDREREAYREALDEIKAECDELNSLLIDDSMIKKGDRVFWITKDGTFAPGRILEMRKKSGVGMGSISDSHYAVIKLERKTKVAGLGPYKSERESAIVSVNELLTFKTFFKEFFEEFRHKLWKILLETNEVMTIEARQKLLRSRFRESSLRLSFDSSTGIKLDDSFFSTSHEAVDCLPVEQISTDCWDRQDETENLPTKKQNTKIKRAVTVSLGTMRPKLRSIGEVPKKSRAKSWHKTSSPLSEASECDTSFSSTFDNNESVIGSPLRTSCPAIHNDEEVPDAHEDSSDFIAVGERVIWYDTYSETPLVGEVASILKYTPCAIVKFDKLPTEERQVYQYRTVPLDQLFPYALSSLDEKLRLAEAYCTLQEFVEGHPEIFQDDDDDEGEDDYYEDVNTNNTDIVDDEEYFTTGSSTDEDIIATVHNV